MKLTFSFSSFGYFLLNNYIPVGHAFMCSNERKTGCLTSFLVRHEVRPYLLEMGH